MIANWKMNKTVDELGSFVEALREYGYLKKQDNQSIVIAPAFTFIDRMRSLLKDTAMFLGAQNVHMETKGAFTGEVSPLMLKDLDVKYVIVGHSERRQFFNETDYDVARKVRACIDNDLVAVACVGETLHERNSNQTFSVIEKQVRALLEQVNDVNHFVIAYEPVWAIGTGISASEFQAQEVHAFIRSLLEKKYGVNDADKISIIYGGSMNSGNAAKLLKQKDIDGGLIGGASLDAKSFSEILKCVGL